MRYEEKRMITDCAHYLVYPKYEVAFPFTQHTKETAEEFFAEKGEFMIEVTDLVSVTAKQLKTHFPMFEVLPVRTTVKVVRPVETLSPEEYKRHLKAKAFQASEEMRLGREARRYPKGMAELDI